MSLELCINAVKASTEYELQATELKRQYILSNVLLFNYITTLIHGYNGSFGSGYPFYALEKDLNGDLPIIIEQVRYNNELIDNINNLGITSWNCADCLVKCGDSMADLKQICKPCPNVDNELKPRKYTIVNSKKMLIDLLNDTNNFLPSTRSKDLVGLRSVVESFIAEVSKFQYLMDMCLKEDIKRNFDKKTINENKEMKKQIKLSEQDLHDIVKESVKLVLNEEHASFGSIYDDDYLELIPLFDIFVEGYALGSDRDEILQEPLYDKNGNEIGYCLNDLNIGYIPNMKR